MKKDSYRRTFKRKVMNASISYAGMTYTAPELYGLEGREVQVTKLGLNLSVLTFQSCL